MAVTAESGMKVAVVGAGQVGANLGGQLLKAGGFEVKYGTRDPSSEKISKLLKEQGGATAGTFHEATAWADAVILATPSFFDDAGIKACAESLGPGVDGKAVLDATNPLTGWPGLEIRWGIKTSGGEVLADALPNAFVFKAFNTVGAGLMLVPDGSTVTGEQLTMLFAGPKEKEAKAAAVIAGVGFKPVYVGPIRYARNLEAIAELWIHLGNAPVGETREDFGHNFHFQTIKN